MSPARPNEEAFACSMMARTAPRWKAASLVCADVAGVADVDGHADGEQDRRDDQRHDDRPARAGDPRTPVRDAEQEAARHEQRRDDDEAEHGRQERPRDAREAVDRGEERDHRDRADRGERPRTEPPQTDRPGGHESRHEDDEDRCKQRPPLRQPGHKHSGRARHGAADPPPILGNGAGRSLRACRDGRATSMR